MNKTASILTSIIATLFLLALTVAAFAQAPETIQLLEPQTEGGKPLMQALKERTSSREFSPDKLPPQVLANLLWAASGINRKESGKRTAPSAHNWQEIDVYAALEEGLYRYDAKAHLLTLVVAEDIRALTGVQSFVREAAVNLVFVADYSRMGESTPEQKDFYAAADTGFISQNVYLYCASEGLATIVRAWIDKPSLAKAMKLGPGHEIILSQTVGYPKK